MDADLYNQKGEKTGSVKLNATFFEVPFNSDLIHQAQVRQHSNARLGLAHAKTRGNVKGSTRKPFRQKGTGNARRGSNKSAQLRGGGIIFGPLNTRNWTKDMPRKQRRKALFSALSEKARNKQVIALDGYKAETPKTKDFAKMIEKLPVERNVLIVIPQKDEIVQKSSSNIANSKTILVNYLNISDLIKYEKVLFLKEAFSKLEEVFGSTSQAKAESAKVETKEKATK